MESVSFRKRSNINSDKQRPSTENNSNDKKKYHGTSLFRPTRVKIASIITGSALAFLIIHTNLPSLGTPPKQLPKSIKIPSSYVETETTSSKSTPPESTATISFCAEKCKHVKEMCTTGLFRDKLSLPAPTCLKYSMTTKDDVYWQNYDPITKTGRGPYKKRNEDTNMLIDWGAKEARLKRQSSNLKGYYKGFKCEEIPTNYTSPMMFPEEFEFITKLLTNAQPATYLEWGCGMSTSFYPLLATEKVIAIDGFPPWCKQVGDEPRVKCMREENKLHFFCPELVGVDGNPVEMMQPVGKLNADTSDEDVLSVMNIYVNSVTKAMEEGSVIKFDVALVDGRFRLQCALKLLPYLHSESVLLMHDFWLRIPAYKDVLDYYYVIGYARSVVALKKKPGLSAEVEWNVYKKYMNRESLTWNDIK